MELNKCKKEKIGDQVFQQLKDMITSGEWQPGTKIPSENELMNMLNISRISVRGALQKLEGIGLLISYQGDGRYVCDTVSTQYTNALAESVAFDKTDLAELMEFRSMFECAIVEKAAKRITPEMINLLKSNYEEHIKETKDFKRLAELDTEFHYLIAKAADNSLVEQMFSIFSDVFLRNMFQIVQIMGIKEAEDYHMRLIEALENHDSKSARKIMKEHIESTAKATLGRQNNTSSNRNPG